MGNQQTTISFQQQANIDKFGKVKYVKFNDQQYKQQEFICVEFDTSEKIVIFQQWLKVIEGLNKQEEVKQFIMLPLKHHWVGGSFFCKDMSLSNKLKVFYSKFDTNLDLQIRNRKQKKMLFDQTQLYYTLYVLLKVCSFFQDKQTYLGNIHLKNIIINQKKEIKIFTTFSSPLQPQNYQLLKQSRFNETFLAPQQFSRIVSEQDQAQQKLDQSKIDTFSIGLILMSMILLNHSCFLYDYHNKTINKKDIKNLKQLLLNQTNYHKNLNNLIYTMLEINPKKRNSPKYYYNFFKKYQKEILSFKEFKCAQFQKAFSTPKRKCRSQKIQLSTKVNSNVSILPISEQDSQNEIEFTFKKQWNMESQQQIKKKLFH